MIYHELSLIVFAFWREQLNITAGITSGKEHAELEPKDVLKVLTFPRAPKGSEGLLD